MALTENCRTYQTPKDSGCAQSCSSDVVELNVGGQVYYTRHATLTSVPNSLLGKLFSAKKDVSNDLAQDIKGRYFIDRDGFLFRYVLDYLRDRNVVLPDYFPEKGRLKREAEFFQLPELVKILTPDEYIHGDFDEASQGSDQRLFPASYLDARDRRYGFITVGYKSSCAFGRDADPKARGTPKIFICGRVGLAKEVFGDTLNESRDPDRPAERYTSQFYLKFRHLERAFDILAESGFHIVACNSSVTTAPHNRRTDDRYWSNNTEYVFYRGPSGWSSSHCDCCCKSHKSEREGESGTSFNELSTSCSETQSEASSPQETVIVRSVTRQPNIQTLDRPVKKGPTPIPRRTDLLRVRTTGPRDSMAGKRKPAKVKMTPEQELEKCIQDFRRIKIPERFPEKKYMWQSELLKKYQL
ncbi:BTB/POZ domain-containing protein KCTD16-like [Sinocyclocheilus rhinocerous]|uniref:BTB/POZ domain-containing protein KCTD16-like n=1 Tax=Sinocyclocheilus rhinocerous TaxID=307959 RepID=UPI0007BA8D64|nr:PREDICTED: BTB/POZ domain-containing protein KCTD16-like [Sinocyclocheilus rhinocerous]XP_016429389.1 PREDICTED: BTB/POZ domain-containing protein KCTD16-like [Sinocyclocheilus rhinocerous]